ncbi:saccharopine dehydrogenase NADP-binding domain-containing protein [Paenibacillus sp.]|jgi:saccharopine dehydrogenase-like NADP-dependent oxidoreductase|uniref:saccharopine dehydrogenase family protein n=1 Tax=Paenibacillus sp. TaxID=58172 RepID=UPI0028289E04|nr:saccharopine dehydrogenase NADP-binding domain-containing protein [Paenibacillus sp.]MDR0270437.1 saccharopine dehydrogenase NADP-binding domain-containing protein [Paenibacillus sp.]
MTENKTIGILGATGNLGRPAVRTILDTTDYHVLLGGRDQSKLQRLFPHMESRGDYIDVDIYNVEQLHNFCRRCDIVLNCAGPSNHIGDMVASACMEQRIHYVDASGDVHLYNQLQKRHEELQDKQMLWVIGVGAYPGLSEIWTAYIAETLFDKIDHLEVFLAGQGGFSLNAAYDIVCSIEMGGALGMNYCQNGEAQKIQDSSYQHYTLPPPAGERKTYLILNEEFRRIAKHYDMKKAYFYNTYPDQSVLHTFMIIKAMEEYKTEEQKKKSAKILSEQFTRKQQGTDDYTMFHSFATGSKNGQTIKLQANLLYHDNWNLLSGIVAANVARLVLEDDRKVRGCFFAAEGIHVSKMMNLLFEQGIVFAHKHFD